MTRLSIPRSFLKKLLYTEFCFIIKTNFLLISEPVKSCLERLDTCGLYEILVERIPKLCNSMRETVGLES